MPNIPTGYRDLFHSKIGKDNFVINPKFLTHGVFQVYSNTYFMLTT
jgi:hypothetical protein